MDSIVEKKWFVYVGDRHEGPFSVEEIQEEMTQGRVSVENFVWTEGMPDWKVMMEIADFGPIPIEKEEVLSPEPNLSEVGQSSDSASEPIITRPVAEITSKATRRTSDPIQSDHQITKIGPSKGWKLFAFLFLCGVITFLFNQKIFNLLQKNPELRAAYDTTSEFSRPYLMKLAERYPILSQWISPIPPIEDVSPDDFEELKAAAQEKIEAGGSRFAIALSRANPTFPKFYISSNLPDGAVFDVYVVGNPDTLMGQTSFVSQGQVTLLKKLGASPIIRYPDGKPVPRGEYTLYLAPAEIQPPPVKSILSTAQLLATRLPVELPKNSKILSYKTYFLGGERDSTYLSRLKSFHDALQARATEELNNVNQYAGTLESQFEASRSKFESLQNRKLTPKQRKTWENFHNGWSALQSELNKNIQHWSPEAIKNEFFYGVLFLLTQQAEQAVEKAHEFQNTYFTKASDPKTLQIQLGEATSSAHSALTLLRSKIEQAEKIPPSPNGMPQRDGL